MLKNIGLYRSDAVGECFYEQDDKKLTLLQTPAEKHDEELLDDIDDSADVDGESTGLVAELPLTLQGYRHSKCFVQ